MNKVYKGAQARKYILDGAKQLYDAVKETYGPTSGNVGILRDLRGLDVTHDGVTVAKSIELKGPERAGAEVIKNTAIKMDKDLGDGTTTVVILAYSIIEAVQDRLLLNESPIKIKADLQAEATLALEALEALTDHDVTLERLKQVAAISASDDALGAQVAEIVYQVGLGGKVAVENGLSSKVEAEVTEGYVIDNGTISNYFISDPSTMTTTLEKPEILIVDKKVDDLQMISDVLQGVKDKPLLIIANDVTEPVLSALIMTNQKGLTNVAIIKSPRFAKKRTLFLEDIAAFVGTSVVDQKSKTDGVKLGHADKVVIGTDNTTIFSGHGDVSERKTIIEGQIKTAINDFEKDEAQQRLAALTGKAAVIKVGGYSDEEVNEVRYRVDDAVFACQAALKSGVVAGGAVTPLNLAKTLPEGSVLKEALQKPFQVLLDNIGMKPVELEVGQGINVRTGETVDLFKEGIIEPADTIRTAIESAVSIAGTAITMKVLVVDEEDDE